MAGYGDIPAIESLLNCAICLDPFEYPKLLNCGHTFCQYCLEQTTPAEALVITCPTCRQKTRKPDTGISGLKHDFKVSQFQDGLNAISQTAPKTAVGPLCAICRTVRAVVCCVDCHKYMCGGCLKKHNIREALAQHTVLKVTDIKTCDEHDENCSHVCVDCGQLVCVTCTQDICSEHTVRSIGEAARRHVGRGNPQARIKDTRIIYSKLRTERAEQFSQAEEQIRTATANLCKMLKEEESKLLRELRAMKENGLSEVEALRLQEEEKVMKIAEAHLNGPDALQNGIPRVLLDALPTLEMLSKKKDHSEVVSFEPKTAASIGELRNAAVEIKRVFRFEKVVLVRRDGITTLLAKHGDIIVRNDFDGPRNNNIKLYRQGVDREYDMDAKHVAKLPIIFKQEWKPYLPNIRPMTYKIKNYAQANNIQLNEMVVKKPTDDTRPPRANSRSRKKSGGY